MPVPPLTASRVKKSRGTFTCPRCKCPVGVGVQIGLVTGLGWCHVVPCIVGGRAPMIGPSNEPSSKGRRP
jgi:hypothetical protein